MADSDPDKPKPTRDDYKVCMAVFILTIGGIGFAMGGPMGALAGAGGGVITGAVVCPLGGAEMVRRAREDWNGLQRSLDGATTGDAAALGTAITNKVASNRTAAIAGLQRHLSIGDAEAGRVFDSTLAWMGANPRVVGQLYNALPKQGGNNAQPMAMACTADVTSSAAGLLVERA